MASRGDRAAIRADGAAIEVVVVVQRNLQMRLRPRRKSHQQQQLHYLYLKLHRRVLRALVLQARSVRVGCVSPALRHSTSFVALLGRWSPEIPLPRQAW
jgi:hypothetical protein